MSIDNIYYNFEIKNSTNNVILADGTDRRLNSIINKPSDYYFSCLKFSLPASVLKSININNQDDYRIRISSYHRDLSSFGPSNQYQVGVYREYKAENSLPLSSEYNYENSTSLIEAYNRTALKSYRDYLYQFDSQFNNVHTFSGSLPEQTLTTAPFSYGITVNNPGQNYSSNSMTYIKLRISNFKSYFYQTSLSQWVAYDSSPVNIYLQNPSNRMQLVVANKVLSNGINDCGSFTFEDASLFSLDENEPMSRLPNGDYYPREPFSSFNTYDGLGNWMIIIESCNSKNYVNNWKFSIDWFLEFYHLPVFKDSALESNLSLFSPVLSKDDKNSLTLKLHESFILRGNRLSHSEKLNNMLQFNSFPMADKFYSIILPEVDISTVVNPALDKYITVTQPVSSLYELNAIRAIQLRSNTLGVYGETSLNSNTNIIMSVDINTDTVKDIFEFASSLQNRYYDILSDSPLSDINISVWLVYSDGSEVLASIQPNTRFFALFKFSKKDRVRL